MAYSKTQNVSLVLVFLTFSQCFQHHPHLAKADSKLIHNLCHATEVPEVCVQCLESDEYADIATEIDLGFILMNCISSHADALQVQMDDSASNSKNKASKSVYNACVKAYKAAKKDLKSAADHLQNYEFEKAESYVVKALVKHHSCYYAIENTKELTISSEVGYEMRIYEELCYSTERILERY